jgi:hypothetical protein
VQVAEAYSESDLPWKIDLIDWATTSEAFRERVFGAEVGVAIGLIIFDSNILSGFADNPALSNSCASFLNEITSVRKPNIDLTAALSVTML